MAVRVTGDDYKLAQLGFDRDFQRELTTYTNFAVAFNIICVSATIVSTLQLAWVNGGPAAVSYGWIIVSVASCCVGLSMAEIVSALPSNGGPFFWAIVLAGKRGPCYGWVTGWFNLLGQVSIVAAAADAIVTLIATMIAMTMSYTLTQPQQLAIYAACLLLAACINSMPGRHLASFSSSSCFMIFCSIIFLTLLLPTIAPWHQSTHFVWETFYDDRKSSSGITNNLYLFLEGTMTAQYWIIGYDCCAHLSEETLGAQESVPRAIVLAIISSSVLGYAFLMSMMFSIQDPNNLLVGNARGYVAAQIFHDAFEARFGSGLVGIVMLIVPLVMMLLCLVACMLAGSRMVHSFSRSRGIPKVFSRVNRQTNMPLRAIWLLTLAAFVLGLLLLKSSTAFMAVVSITNVSLLVSYAIPIICRHTIARKYFVPGPFQLGKFSTPIGVAAVVWISTAMVVFLLPATYPITLADFNFASVMVAIMLLGSLGAWYNPRWGAKHFFVGPVVNAELFQPPRVV